MPSSSTARRAPPGASAELWTKLVWVTAFRTVAVTLLLAVSVVRLLANPPLQGPSTQDSLIFAAITAVYLLTLGYALWLRRREVGPGAAWLQVGADILLASGLVYITGGADSPYAFTYLLAVVAGSILLYQRGAVVAAVSSGVAFTSLALAIQFEIIPAAEGSEKLAASRLAFTLVSNLLAQVLIAALATYLARQLWTTGGRLSAREADLRHLAELHRRILGAMPSGLITCDGNTRITFVNRAASAILGIDPQQAVGDSIDGLIPGTRALMPGRRSEVVVATRFGERTLGLTTSPLEETTGEMLVVFQDLTDLRRMEEEMKRVDRLAALGKLSAQLAHEIRNPLAAMRGSAQLLASETGGDPASARLVGVLVRESDRLSALVDDFLRFARPPPPSLRTANLAQLAEETVEMLLEDPLARGIRVDVRLQQLDALVDADQLRQVLINLLRNAFAAAGPDGGEVRVTVESGDRGPLLKVWDSAGAIAPEDIGRIFEPFFTRRAGGTGLGLSTAHSIVRAQGGSIEVSSSPERGTEFVVTLRATEAPHASIGS